MTSASPLVYPYVRIAFLVSCLSSFVAIFIVEVLYNSHMDKEILVLGCGVSGLSTGILLLQSGYSVTIWAKDLPPNTTSNKAAAIWYPYLCFPREKAIPWAKETFTYFQQHMINDPKSGCMYRTITELFTKQQPEPW